MRIRKKRRRQGKTDYKARVVLLKGGLPRLVVRKTNKYIILQYVESEEAKDRVVYTVNSKKLLRFGWPEQLSGSLKSLAASYLSGFLLGKMLKERYGSVVAILDIGLLRNKPKGRVYAGVRGVIDSGIKIKCKKEMLPDEQRIRTSSKLSDIFDKIKNKIEND